MLVKIQACRYYSCNYLPSIPQRQVPSPTKVCYESIVSGILLKLKSFLSAVYNLKYRLDSNTVMSELESLSSGSLEGRRSIMHDSEWWMECIQGQSRYSAMAIVDSILTDLDLPIRNCDLRLRQGRWTSRTDNPKKCQTYNPIARSDYKNKSRAVARLTQTYGNNVNVTSVSCSRIYLKFTASSCRLNCAC